MVCISYKRLTVAHHFTWSICAYAYINSLTKQTAAMCVFDTIIDTANCFT